MGVRCCNVAVSIRAGLLYLDDAGKKPRQAEARRARQSRRIRRRRIILLVGLRGDHDFRAGAGLRRGQFGGLKKKIFGATLTAR